MQSLNQILKAKKPDLKQVSLDRYSENLKKLANLMNTDNLDFLESNYQGVIDTLRSKYQDATTRNYLNAIIVYMTSDDDDSDALTAYKDLRDEINNSYFKAKKNESIPTNKQITTEQIEDLIAKLESLIKKYKIGRDTKDTITKTRYNILLDHLILSFYNEYRLRNDLAMLRRCANVREYNRLMKENPNDNYIVCGPRNTTLHLNSYKTNTHYGGYTLDVSNNIHKIFKRFNKVNKGDTYLLNSFYGKPITKNNLSKMILSIFDRYLGLKVSTTMLRKNYLTNKYAKVKKEMEHDADVMMHSVDTQQKVYVTKK